jgi:hypothetical protein
MHSDDAAASAPSNGFSALTFAGTASGGTYSGYRVVSSIGTYSTGWTTILEKWAASIASFRASGTPVSLMSKFGPTAISVGRVKYRLAIPGSQASGTYTTKITYIVTPTY